MGYGYEAKDTNDRMVKVAKDILQLMAEVATPGALLVNVLPFCESSLVFDKFNHFNAHSP
jgi:hypothetical protein